MNSRRDSWKHLAVEGWVFVVIAALAFVGGFVIGDFGASPKTETVYVAAPSTEEGETEAGAAGGETASTQEGAAGGGSQLFASAGCGACHTLAAAGTTGQVGPNLDEFLAPDDTTAGVEEMLVNPNVELAEGYPANVMPQNYGQTFSKAEVHELAEYLVETTPAKPDPK